jgi:hypothetical protein
MTPSCPTVLYCSTKRVTPQSRMSTSVDVIIRHDTSANSCLAVQLFCTIRVTQTRITPTSQSQRALLSPTASLYIFMYIHIILIYIRMYISNCLGHRELHLRPQHLRPQTSAPQTSDLSTSDLRLALHLHLRPPTRIIYSFPPFPTHSLTLLRVPTFSRDFTD